MVKLLTSALVAAALALAGCMGTPDDDDGDMQGGTPPTTPTNGGGGAAPPTARYTSSEFKFDGPASIPAGLVTIELANSGAELHHIQLVELRENKTLQDLGAALAQPAAPRPEWAVLRGGPNVPAPRGGVTNATLDLPTGSYAILCVIPGADGVPHFAKGMARPLRVANATANVAEPMADATVTLSDFEFDAPASVKAGNVTLHVVNEGPHTHEAVVFELFGNATPMQFLQAAFGPNATGPPPGRPVGGISSIANGQEAWVPVGLTPGRYFLVCFDNDGTQPREEHFLRGMIREFAAA